MAEINVEEFIADNKRRREEITNYWRERGYERTPDGKWVKTSVANNDTLETTGNELLTPTEAGTLGVPYGTTKKEAAEKKITVNNKTKSATAGLEEATYRAIKQFSSDLQSRFDEKGDLPGVGYGYTGSIEDILYQMGWLKGEKYKKGSENRVIIGNIKSALAKLRGGTSFTANEEKLLNTYTPNENDSPAKIKDKLTGLQNYLKYRAEIAGVETDKIDKPQNNAQEDEIDTFLKGF